MNKSFLPETSEIDKLHSSHPSGLELIDEWVFPNYSGRSILNLPSSICSWLGVPGIGAAPLDRDVTAPLGGSFRSVILVLIDGLSYQRLIHWLRQGLLPPWQQLSEHGILTPITSIAPSTTSAAIISLWTGRSPFEHGITGYEMWMKEYGIVVNTILQMPITFKSDLGALERTGFKPEEYLHFQTLGTHLKANGVQSYAFQHQNIAYSSLSRMFNKDLTTQAFNTPSDLWVKLRHLLENKSNERFFTWVYWGEVDHFSHIYGPDDERTIEEFRIFIDSMLRLFLDHLSPSARQNTLLLLTADHGMLSTPSLEHSNLRNHNQLIRHLHLMPTGENRMAYLYIRPGRTDAVREYITRTWPDQFVLLDSADAVEKGLFGQGVIHPGLLDRVGDLILLGRGNSYLWWADKENHMLGRHGGLHPEEMIVPLFASSL